MTEDELFSQVRAAFQALDPMPGEVLAAGRSALGWRERGAALAEIAEDRRGHARGVRGDGTGTAPRTLTFSGPGRTVEIEVTGTGRYREVAGRIVPGGPAHVRVRHPALARDGLTGRADPAGQFAFPRVPEGMCSLVFLLPDTTSIVTSWIRL